MDFQVWVKTENERFIVYDYKTKLISEVSRLPQNINCFYLPKCDCDDISKTLIEYAEQLISDRNELMNCKSLKVKFDYFNNQEFNNKIFYRTHTNNVITLFKILKMKVDYKTFDPIDRVENSWFSKTNNGGLIYLKETGIKECFGYDFKMYYPSILASTDYKIPTKSGKEKTINVLPKHLQFGFYRVAINSSCNNFNRIFAYSKYNVYTNEVLKYAREMATKYDIQITLITDGKPNAYVYEQKDLITGDKLFLNWFNRLKDLKKELPKNKLVKMLSSSLWGHLSEQQTIYKTEDEVLKEKLNIGMSNDADYLIINMTDNGERTLFELQDKTKNLYKYNIRLKPFITGYGRIKIAKLIEENNLGDKLLRIQTDGIILSEPYEFNMENVLKEEKTTGTLEFIHVNNYSKVNVEK